MTLEELGLQLKAEREKRGLDLDRIAGQLKISARILRALEEGDESSLPHTVYVRGFIRSYGNYLGMDSEELQAAMQGLGSEVEEVQATSVYATPEADGGRGGSRILLTFVALLCVAGGVFFWMYRDADLFPELTQARLTTAQPAPPLTSREEAPKPNKAKGKEEKAVKDNRTAESSKTTESTPTARTAPPAPAVPAITPTAPVTAAPSAPAVDAAPTAPPAPVGAQNTKLSQAGAQNTQPVAGVTGSHKVIITALSECWIHSNADDTDTRQFSLRKGDTFALTFANKLSLKLGNAGGVRLRYDGEELPIPGRDGQVRTLTFPPQPQ